MGFRLRPPNTDPRAGLPPAGQRPGVRASGSPCRPPSPPLTPQQPPVPSHPSSLLPPLLLLHPGSRRSSRCRFLWVRPPRPGARGGAQRRLEPSMWEARTQLLPGIPPAAAPPATCSASLCESKMCGLGEGGLVFPLIPEAEDVWVAQKNLPRVRLLVKIRYSRDL